MSQRPRDSMRVAPAGTAVDADGPTAVITPPRTITVWSGATADERIETTLTPTNATTESRRGAPVHSPGTTAASEPHAATRNASDTSESPGTAPPIECLYKYTSETLAGGGGFV